MDINIIAMSQDPVYIGTGGFTIGRVDNTIVRDPITRIPKIPGTSMAGTWRYYMALKLYSYFKDEYKQDRSKRKEKTYEELYDEKAAVWVKNFDGNRFAAIRCAGQDDEPNDTVDESKNTNTGHCGQCIVCKTFGFSKKDKSERGMVYFSDLNILLFPVYTSFGTRWITSKGILETAGINIGLSGDEEEVIVFDDIFDKINIINLGWLNFKTNKGSDSDKNEIIKFLEKYDNLVGNKENFYKKVVIVSDNLIGQIINSNLETRTSVSIDPTTGAAKPGALFTSEAIPRGTIFYGSIRIEKRPLSEQPSEKYVKKALEDSKKYFETLGIGGMVTRGFGRMKIFNIDEGGRTNEKS